MERTRKPAFWVALLLALAIGAVISIAQLDRQARSNARLAEILPVGYGGFADEQRAALALSTDPVSAEPYVFAVARARPVDISHLSHLAVWAAEADRMDLASDVLNEAATRGWRDTFVQVSVLGSAAAQGNLDAAAQRLDALARFQAPAGIMMRALDIMFTLEGAEAPVAEQVAKSEYLQDVLVDYARDRPQSGKALNGIISAMSRGGTELDCVRRTDIVRAMLLRGDPLARPTWGNSCPAASTRTLDFSFEQVEDDPFAWSYQSEAGLSVRSGREAGSITITNRKLVEKVAAWKFLTLPVGTHSITVAKSEQALRTIADSGPASFDISVLCIGGLSGSDRVLGRIESEGTFSFSVPQACAAQQLRVRLGRGRIEDLRLQIS